MPRGKPKKKPDQHTGTKDETPAGPLTHPLRARILEVVNERPLSPAMFVKAGLAPGFPNVQNALSQVSYHFKILAKAGCIEVVEERQVRGANEHVYAGKMREVFFSDEEFAAMPLEERAMHSRIALQGLMARSASALEHRTFDAHTDRHLTWRAGLIDEEGWAEILPALERQREEIYAMIDAAEERIGNEEEGKVIPFTHGVLGFESPPDPFVLPDADTD